MAETFPAAPAPWVGLVDKTTARVSEASFGDGYTQRSADGLNSQRKEVQLSWRLLTKAEADTIDAFLAARGGHEAFEFTLPDEATPRLWTCREWSRGYDEGLLRNITASFREEFL